MIETNIAAVIVAVLIAGAGFLLGTTLARRRVRARTERSRRLGRAGAERALALLRRRGYRVLETEVTAIGVVHVDGERVEFRVRADAIVRRWWRRYVAEFKGGPEASRIANRATRRQLLEYSVVFGTPRLLLVDSTTDRVHRIDFPK